MSELPEMPRFTLADADRANEEWGANCGPGALAAIAGLTLDEVRPRMGDFESKRYTNPTLMFAALKSIGVKHEIKRQEKPGAGCWDWPLYGLCRIQWEGPWTEPGVPIKARYRYTHWIGACFPHFCRWGGIFDINCMNNGSGWVCDLDWRNIVVPHILEECVPRANGKWHVTHVVEVERPVQREVTVQRSHALSPSLDSKPTEPRP